VIRHRSAIGVVVATVVIVVGVAAAAMVAAGRCSLTTLGLGSMVIQKYSQEGKHDIVSTL